MCTHVCAFKRILVFFYPRSVTYFFCHRTSWPITHIHCGLHPCSRLEGLSQCLITSRPTSFVTAPTSSFLQRVRSFTDHHLHPSLQHFGRDLHHLEWSRLHLEISPWSTSGQALKHQIPMLIVGMAMIVTF